MQAYVLLFHRNLCGQSVLPPLWCTAEQAKLSGLPPCLPFPRARRIQEESSAFPACNGRGDFKTYAKAALFDFSMIHRANFCIVYASGYYKVADRCSLHFMRIYAPVYTLGAPIQGPLFVRCLDLKFLIQVCDYSMQECYMCRSGGECEGPAQGQCWMQQPC